MKETLKRVIRRLGFDVHRYPEASERLEAHLHVLMDKVIIDALVDVGANEGQFAREIRRMRPELFIISFEPNPAAFERLRRSAEGDASWVVRKVAVGSRAGIAKLNVFASDDFSSCLEPTRYGLDRFARSLGVVDQIEVPMDTLDHLLDSEPSPRVRSSRSRMIKLDTQGYDLEALRGAQGQLNYTAVVIVEASLLPLYEGAALFSEIMAFLVQRGFELSGFFPVTRDEKARIIEANCVFVNTR